MKNINRLRERQRLFYKSIVSIYCPILDDTVYFTSEGFNHLLYESNRKPRTISEQYMKLRCLLYVPAVIEHAESILETRVIKRKIAGKLKLTIHYALIYDVRKGRTLRVIIEKIGTGKHKFLSVMMHKKERKQQETKKRPNGRS